MINCLFCKITQGEITTKILHEDDKVIAFKDIAPQAPLHIVIIPRKHIATLNDLATEDTYTVGQMIQVARYLAKENGYANDGYRLVMNCNKQGGQMIFHLHLHLLAGRQLDWPPG